MSRTPDVEDLLPLRPAVFGILVVLRNAPLHGYGIMKQANRHVGRQAVLGPGTLYRILKELRGSRLVEHTSAPSTDADARRHYYRLTELGARVVAAEKERLRALLRTVPESGLAADPR